MSFTIGLTGGIGSGKSSAAEIFAQLGIPVIDTDEISRQLTQPGSPALAVIRGQFGDSVFLPDGGLDRAAMRTWVFNDPAARKKLEAILHPLIRQSVADRLPGLPGPYSIIMVPLLLETGSYRELVNRVLVVDCDEALQVARTLSRSGLDEAEVRAIMASQLPRQARLALADDVILNDGDTQNLYRQVAALHQKYLDLARAAPLEKGARSG